jgi:hypothetical protein
LHSSSHEAVERETGMALFEMKEMEDRICDLIVNDFIHIIILSRTQQKRLRRLSLSQQTSGMSISMIHYTLG